MLSAISFGVLRRSAPSTSAIIRSRNDLPGSCVTSITSRSESSLRAAGDGRAVAAGLADHGRRLAGDRRLVDRADALDDLAVGGDDLARLDDDDVAALQLGRRHLLERAVAQPCAIVVVRVARSAFACALPRPSAIASAKFANSTVSQSQIAITPTNQSCPCRPRARSRKKIAGRDHAAELDDEHHRVLELQPRVELRERVPDRRERRARARRCLRGVRAITRSPWSSARLSSRTLTPGSPKKPQRAAVGVRRRSAAARSRAAGARTAAMRRACSCA